MINLDQRAKDASRVVLVVLGMMVITVAPKRGGRALREGSKRSHRGDILVGRILSRYFRDRRSRWLILGSSRSRETEVEKTLHPVLLSTQRVLGPLHSPKHSRCTNALSSLPRKQRLPAISIDHEISPPYSTTITPPPPIQRKIALTTYGLKINLKVSLDWPLLVNQVP